jgi:hypothetical protein
MPHVSHERRLAQAVRALVSLFLFPLCAFPGMVTITIGGVPIGGISPFIFAGANPATGYNYSGTVDDGPLCGSGGGNVGFMNIDLCLTDFTVNGSNGNGGDLTFTFSEPFPGPLPAGFAADVITGNWLVPGMGPGLADTITWQGQAGNPRLANIAPPAGAIVKVDPALIVGVHGGLPIGATLAGGALVLQGTLTVNLKVRDGVMLPDSAEVSFSAPEPSTLELLSAGALCLALIWLRHGLSALVHCS